MGCVRDQIPTPVFTKNIVKLHRETGTSITIVVQDEGAWRKIGNGLKLKDFIDLLRSNISEELASENCLPLLLPTSFGLGTHGSDYLGGGGRSKC